MITKHGKTEKDIANNRRNIVVLKQYECSIETHLVQGFTQKTDVKYKIIEINSNTYRISQWNLKDILENVEISIYELLVEHLEILEVA